MDRSRLASLVPKMLDKFPLMVPNRQFSEYRGFLSPGEADLYLHISVPNLPSIKDIKIKEMSKILQKLLEGSDQELQQITKSSDVQATVVKSVEVPIEFWRDVVSNLSSIGFENVKCVDKSNLSHFELKVESAVATHCMQVEANPDGSFQCKCPNLPEVAVQIIAQCPSVPEAYKMLKRQVENLQTFWHVVKELDQETWVLDPVEPNQSHTRRQISIETGLSVTVTIDPYNPLLLPEISFLGSEAKVKPIEIEIYKKEWCVVENSLLKSLQKYLNIEFPTPPDMNSSQLSQSQMCSICIMSEGLNRTCEDCGGQFHEECLLGWLQSVPSNKTVFNRIAGQCPLCKQVISCAIAAQ
ncbi:E3 ubiquitin-protein ligase FANCL-like isoform X2 [Neocloeon triangulifer]|uniref:E3 ubiquitin-protein ligase FANCL-like isoform X2 n=1 Tax=Neocloeon triangulifer TaxID=2078957 RepID=UPI00286F1C0E|nr:E3 ubiquitin-protein ligase FANCL-like isoform X2 [Neocloeon triangulifer]